MIGTAGNEKSDDVLVKVDLGYNEGLDIELKSKIEKLFGKQIIKCAKDQLESLGVKNAKVEIIDFGALDFVIKARIKTAVDRARRGINE